MPKETLRQETRRVYAEMYEDGIEPFRMRHRMSAERFPPLESKAAVRNFAILMILGIPIIVVPIVYMFARFT